MAKVGLPESDRCQILHYKSNCVHYACITVCYTCMKVCYLLRGMLQNLSHLGAHGSHGALLQLPKLAGI